MQQELALAAGLHDELESGVHSDSVFFCPCVFPDGQSSSCRKGSPQLIQTRQRHRRGDREAAPSPGRGIEAFLSLMFTLGNLCDIVTD